MKTDCGPKNVGGPTASKLDELGPVPVSMQWFSVLRQRFVGLSHQYEQVAQTRLLSIKEEYMQSWSTCRLCLYSWFVAVKMRIGVSLLSRRRRNQSFAPLMQPLHSQLVLKP